MPREAAEAARANAAFTVDAVNEREKVTDHDVAAFVDVVAAGVGEHGRWIHYGLTSSDVLDTALALQLREAGEVVLASARAAVADDGWLDTAHRNDSRSSAYSRQSSRAVTVAVRGTSWRSAISPNASPALIGE